VSGQPLVSIVICAKNNARTIERCFNSVFNLDYPNKAVMVVDGCSTDGTLDIAKKFNVKVYSDGGKGLAYARDLGWRKAEGEFIAYIDADMIINSDWILQMLKRFMEDERLAGLEDQTFSFPEEGYLSKLDDYGYRVFNLRRTSGKWTFRTIGTANSLWRRKALEDVDGFDYRFRYTSEDGDLSYRLYKRGWNLGLCMEAVSYHSYRSTWRGCFKRQFYYGYGNYQLIKKHKSSPAMGTVLKWFLSPIAGIKHAIVAYKLTRDKICVLFPFHYAFKKYASIIGYCKAMADDSRGRLK